MSPAFTDDLLTALVEGQYSEEELPTLPPIGEYRLVRSLGQGAMGRVYVAKDTLLDRLVAIKFLLNFGDDSAARDRFVVEARAIARLSHPNVVGIYRIGELFGRPYLVSEFVRGETLDKLPKPIPWTRVLEIGIGLSRGLAAAHASGVLHRDIKPQNAILTEAGEVKLLDFGLAKLVDLQQPAPHLLAAKTPSAGAAYTSLPPLPLGSETSGDSQTLPAGTPFPSAHTPPIDFGGSTSLTQAGAVVGTPRYMAPEMWLGKPATFQVDIYSLGVLLYELAAGHSPHNYDTVGELRQAVLDTPPMPLRSLAPSVPPRLAEIIDRCVSRDPDARPASAEALCQSLEQVESAGHLRSAGLSLLKRAAIAFGALLLLGGGLYARARLWPRRGTPAQLSGMVYLPGGTFEMGSTPLEADAALQECRRTEPQCIPEVYEREQPRRHVTLSPFYLDKTEVQNQEFARWLNVAHVDGTVAHDRLVKKDRQLLVDLHPRWSAIVYQDRRFSVRPGFERKPVLLVTWQGANLYCQSHGKRLPTEAQWEFAARGGQQLVHPWGNEPPRCDGVAFGRRIGRSCAPAQAIPDGGSTPPANVDGGVADGGAAEMKDPRGAAAGLASLLIDLPDVGSMAMDVSPQGIHDLAGSAQEWVFDRYMAPYPDCGACRDPVVDKETDTPMRAVRGGDYQSQAGFTRAAERARWKQEESAKTLGFRCAAPAVL